MRRFLVLCALLVAIATGIAFASFQKPSDYISYLVDPNDISKGFNEDFKNILGSMYWLRSDSFGSSVKYQTDYVKDPDGKSMKGELVPSGSSVDKAWTIEAGDPRIIIAIIDTGVQWEKAGLVNKYYLNKGELHCEKKDHVIKNAPAYITQPDGTETPVWDRNGDGVFNIKDYEPDGRYIVNVEVDKKKLTRKLHVAYKFRPEGYNGHPAFFSVNSDNNIEFYKDTNNNQILDPGDLIEIFSDGYDSDGNGYVDDICGWDFLENDNNPHDVSSYTMTARYHGNGQAMAAGGEFFDNTVLIDELGTCPNCMIMPLKTWDSFVQDTNYYGQAVFYAAFNGAHVIEGALGGLSNSGLCKDAVEYAYKKGMAIFMVSSDINSANHNWPTYLNEPIYCTGIVPDTGIDGVDPVLVRTWYRNSGLCQFGPKNHISFEVVSGSHSTALSSGAGGLLISHAKKMVENRELEQKFSYESGMPVHPDQIKQLLTLSAEDVVPDDTYGASAPDPCQPGWDQHFGYGRVNLYWAVKMLNDGKLPPVARITSPAWSQYLDPRKDTLDLKGDVLFAGTDAKKWVVEAAYGVEPNNNSFKRLADGSYQGEGLDFGGPISLDRIRELMPKGLDLGYYPKEPDLTYRGDANIQANRHMFTVRLKVLNSRGVSIAEDRRTFFLSEDKNFHEGWPKFMGVGGEAAVRFDDLDGDNKKEVVIATSDGRILLYRHDGSPFKFKGSEIVLFADDIEFDRKGRVDLKPIQDDVNKTIGHLPTLRPSFVTPAIADIDNDGMKEIVGVAGRHMYCFRLDGTRLFTKKNFGTDKGDNFTLDVEDGKVFNADHDPKYPGYENDNSTENPISPGAMAPPVLYDINNDGFKEIIVAAGDQRIYAWDRFGRICTGWPVYARAYEKSGQKFIYSPCIADLDGDGKPELVAMTNEVIGPRDDEPITNDTQKAFLNRIRNLVSGNSKVLADSKISLPGSGGGLAGLLDTITNTAGKDCLVYAIKGEGNGDYTDYGRDHKFSKRSFVKGWPVSLKALLPDILPHLGPSTKPAAFDYDNDGADEVVANATSAQTAIIDGSGKIVKQMNRAPMGSKAQKYLNDQTVALDLYDSVAIGNLDRDDNIEIAQGGLTLLGALNLFLSGLNFPFNHVMQVWDSKSGSFEEAFPRPVDDFVLYAEPAIADVDGDGVNEVLTGSGLFLLHAIGMDGLDRGVFPKLTAGWIMMTPTIDDIDGDGVNEVAAVTREGGIFIWDTEGKYTAGKDGRPQTWPTYGHDNWNTSNLGNDAIAPAGITEYEWTSDGFTFRCPGDDGLYGRAKELKIYGYSSPINNGNINEASLVKTITSPANGGLLVYLDIPNEFAYYAVIAKDDAGNTTQLMLEGGPMTKEQIKAAGEASSDDGGGNSGLCFINLAINS